MPDRLLTGLAAAPARYLVLVRASMQSVLAYRGRLVLDIVSFPFPFLLMAVWLTVVAGGGPPRGWTAGDFVAYYAVAALLFQLSGQHVVWQWDQDLRSGDLSVRLMRPLHPFHQYLAADLGHDAVLLVIGPVLIGLLAVVVPVLSFDLTVGGVGLALVATVLGYLVGVLMASLVALLGFWSTQTTNVWMLVWGVGSFTSGWVAPVGLLPGWLQDTATWLPFYATLGFPVEQWTGRAAVPPGVGLAVAAGWAVVFAAAYVALWPRAVRRYQAVAG